MGRAYSPLNSWIENVTVLFHIRSTATVSTKVNEVKYSRYEAIYIGNTQQTFNKIMDGHFSNLLRILKNGQKQDSCSAHFEQHFNDLFQPKTSTFSTRTLI